jgi:Tfp pilus assembly protein FimT
MFVILALVVAFGVAGMAQMLQSQRPSKGADSNEFPQVR